MLLNWNTFYFIVCISCRIYLIVRLTDVLYELPKVLTEYNVKTTFSYFGPYPTMYTIDPKVVEIILNSPNCIDKPLLYNVISHVIGDSLLTHQNPLWHSRRKLMNPSFSHKALLEFIPIFSKLTDELCDTFQQHVGGGEVNVKDLTFHATLNLSIGSIFGIDINAENNIVFVKNWERLAEMVIRRILNPGYWNSTIFSLTTLYKPYTKVKSAVMNFVYDLIAKKIAILKIQESGEEADPSEESFDVVKAEEKSFVDQLIKIHLKNELTYDDVVAEAAFMSFASYETTASTIFSALMFLAMHPHYQEKVFEEILAVIPDEDSYVDLKSLVYLDMCINETLRIATPIPFIARQITDDAPLSKDLVIPKGVQIIIDMFNMHRDKDIWGPNALSFDPDNFLPANVAARQKYSFIPFSKGQRNCIGWQYVLMFLKTNLSKILRKYRFTTKFPYEDLKFFHRVSLTYSTYPLLEIHQR